MKKEKKMFKTKSLSDDSQVPERCWYYLLDWKDSNLDEFAIFTGKKSFKRLN